MIYLLLTWLAAPWLWLRANLKTRGIPRRVLVIQTAKIGDFVATTPVFRALRRRLPQSEVVALLHPVNVPLAEGLDSIDRIVVLPPAGFAGWAGKRWLLQQLTSGDYDAVLVLSPNLSTLLAPFWAAVPRRVSVLPDRRQGSARLAWPFLTYAERHHAGQLFRETALRALAGLNINVDAELLALPAELICPGAAAERARTMLDAHAGPFVGLGLGAGNRMKALDKTQLTELTGQLLGLSLRVVLIGTSADQQLAAELCALFPNDRLIDTTSQWPLADLPALLAGLDCFVGVDSGATYMADAVGVPVVDFMGPADADDQRPIGRQAIVIRSAEPCAPCSHAFDAPYACHLGTRACVINMPIAAVVQAVKSILAPKNAVTEYRK